MLTFVPIECNYFCRDGLHCDVVWTHKDKQAPELLKDVHRNIQNITPVKVEPVHDGTPEIPIGEVFRIGGTMIEEPLVAWALYWRPKVPSGSEI